MKIHTTLRFGLVAVLAFVSGPLALVAAFGFLVIPALGVSYPVANATTKTNLTDQNANLEEEIWSLKVVKGAEAAYQDNPLADGFMGEGDGGKAIVKITDTEKVNGSTVHVTTYGGFAGPGVQGANTRVGSANKIQAGSFDVKIGRQWFGVGYQDVARDETMIGGRLDGMIREGLTQQHAIKNNDDLLRLMIAQSEASSRNKMFTASGPSTIATIKTAHYLDTATLGNVKNALTSNGALPMATGAMDSGGSRTRNYMVFGTHFGLSHLKSESDYLAGIRLAGERGDRNPQFKGNFVDWDGIGLYRWDQLDHGNWGPIGSLLGPRMYLGRATTGITFAGTAAGANAITSTDTSSAAYGAAFQGLEGGGSAVAAAALPQPEYTRYFSNAPWTYHWGTTIAADTSTARYVMVIHPTTGAWGVFRYTLNDGKLLKLSHNYKLGLTGETTDWVFPIGSLAVECNIIGTPFGGSIGFGAEALICGVGTINGSKVSPQFGKRTEYHSPHDVDHEIGAEKVWGAALVARSDGVCPGFVVIRHALPVPGAPVIV